MKLEVGAGEKPLSLLPEWEHMDIKPLPHIEIVGDGLSIPRANGYYDEVYSHWVLEHFGRLTLPIFLSESFRVLKKGGLFKAVTSNGEAINKALVNGLITWEFWNYLTFTDGPEPESFHKIGFSEKYARQLLEKAGFREIETEAQWECQNSSGEQSCPALIITARK